jgi:hypothetical protein
MRIRGLAFSTLVAVTAACGHDRPAELDGEWRQMMRCSAYYTLRAASAQESRTAAGRRTADAARADAALAFEYSHELGRLAGNTLADTDTALREITGDLRGIIDADLSNIGRLRARYEDQCATIVAGGETRVEYWGNELMD